MARPRALRRSGVGQGDGVINTAYLERLNATFRERLASLTRRGRALARRPLTLQQGMYLIGTVYHFCTPHTSLAHAGSKTTPAMAAGITDHCWSVQELLSYSCAAASLDAPQAPWASLACAQTHHEAVVRGPRLAVELPTNFVGNLVSP